MANNTFTYIDTDIDRDLLLTNLRHNAQKYARHKGWDDSRAREFYNALREYMSALNDGRLSLDFSGDILDNLGALNNGTANWRDKNGKVLTLEEYNNLGRRDKRRATNDFYANREAASYINNIARGIYNETKDPGEDFSINTHGLWKAFTNYMSPNGVWDKKAWWNLDPYNPTTKARLTTNRAAKLSEYIGQYIDKLPEKVNFAKSPFKTREAYINILRQLQNELLTKGASDIDYRFLNMAGVDPAMYRLYFSTLEDPDHEDSPAVKPTATPAGSNSGSDGNSGSGNSPKPVTLTPEDKAAINQIEKDLLDRFTSDAKYRQVYQLGPDETYGIEYDDQAEDVATAYMNALNSENLGEASKSTALQTGSGADQVRFLAQYGELFPALTATPTSSWYASYKYFPSSLNTEDYTVMAYDPQKKSVRRLYYGALGDEAHKDLMDMLTKNYLEQKAKNQADKKQEGGSIENSEEVEVVGEDEEQAGAPSGVTPYTRADYLNAHREWDTRIAEQSKRTMSDPKLKRLPLFSSKPKENQYSNIEITGTEIARLAALAGNLASAFTGPGVGTALGVASDITNLVADLNDGVSAGTAWGTFAANLGLSALSIIPVFGSAVGATGKITKSLIKLAPKIKTLYGALGAAAVGMSIANYKDIKESLDKIGKKGPENELNLHDYRNIITGIQAILSVKNAAKSINASRLIRKHGAVDGVDVKVQDSNGNLKTLRFVNKADVKKLKEATTPAEVNAVVSRYNKGKYTVVTDNVTTKAWFGNGWSMRNLRPSTTSTVLTEDAVMPSFSVAKARSSGKLGSRAMFVTEPGKNAQRYFWEDPKVIMVRRIRQSGNKKAAAAKTADTTPPTTPPQTPPAAGASTGAVPPAAAQTQASATTAHQAAQVQSAPAPAVAQAATTASVPPTIATANLVHPTPVATSIPPTTPPIPVTSSAPIPVTAPTLAPTSIVFPRFTGTIDYLRSIFGSKFKLPQQRLLPAPMHNQPQQIIDITPAKKGRNSFQEFRQMRRFANSQHRRLGDGNDFAKVTEFLLKRGDWKVKKLREETNKLSSMHKQGGFLYPKNSYSDSDWEDSLYTRNIIPPLY